MTEKSKSALDDFVRVPIEKLHPNTVAPVDIYVFMPENSKLLLYKPAKSILSQANLTQMQTHADRFYIKESDISAMEDFINNKTLNAIEKLADMKTQSPNEVDAGSKAELQLKSMELLSKHFHFIVDPSSGVPAVEQVSQHISKVVDDVLNVLEVDGGILAKVKSLQETMGSNDWDHSVNVSALSALLAMTIGYTDKGLLKDIATAGYLHDMGLVYCNVPLPGRELKYTPEEFERYKDHPRAALELIDTLELPVSEQVKLVIYQHEERYDGAGFPMKLAEAGIFEPAQLVAIADELDELIRIDIPGFLKPEEALKKILEENSVPGKPSRYNPIVINQIYEAAVASGVLKSN